MHDNALAGSTMPPTLRKSFVHQLVIDEVPVKQRAYYVLRANQFLNAVGNREIATLSSAVIWSIIQRLGIEYHLTNWQVAQLLDAVRILLVCCLGQPQASRIDWSSWRSSTSVLPADHATLAREKTPEELVHLRKQWDGLLPALTYRRRGARMAIAEPPFTQTRRSPDADYPSWS